MFIEKLFIPVGAALQMTAADFTPEGVLVDLRTTAQTADCPTCAMSAHRVHSHYQRRLADLPLAQIPVRVHLHIRRFRCDTLTCGRTTFSEPVPKLAAPYARRTARLRAEQRQLALDVGGEPGARLARRQGMGVSPDTLLRLARRAPEAVRPTPRCLGIDDFALRKGQVYGTLLVDLETHQPVDLREDRSAEVVEQWLQAHPGVAIITRDRSTAYADGASRGAPDACQVADRFHLLQNVREMLQRVLDGQQEALVVATRDAAPASTDQQVPAAETVGPPQGAPAPAPPGGTASLPAPAPAVSASPLCTAMQRSQERRSRRQERYTAVRALHAQGVGIRAIAAQLHLSRNTVRRFVAASQFPERATKRPQPSKLDPFIPHLEAQLVAGQDNAMQLWRELREQHGYRGSRGLVSRWVAQHRHVVPLPDPNRPPQRGRGRPPTSSPSPKPPAQRRLSARQAAWLLVRRPEKLKQEEQRSIERLCQQAPTVEVAYDLAQEFIQMVRERQAEPFDGWLQRASASGIAELQSFVVGVERDKAAVVAALSSPYNNGQVEGQVNRLKLIKRSMYGRAKFDLLRRRVLARSS